MQTVTKAILEYNRGRDAERLKIKLAAIRADIFAFFRGTCPLFYSTLRLDRSLAASPAVLACGDLHLQNFGSYKGDNRLVYFDRMILTKAALPVAFDWCNIHIDNGEIPGYWRQRPKWSRRLSGPRDK